MSIVFSSFDFFSSEPPRQTSFYRIVRNIVLTDKIKSVFWLIAFESIQKNDKKNNSKEKNENDTQSH